MTDATDPFAELTRRGHQLFAAAVQAWEQAARSLAEAGRRPEGRLPEVRASLDAAFDFAAQMLAEQRDFARTLMSVTTQALTTTAQRGLPGAEPDAAGGSDVLSAPAPVSSPPAAVPPPPTSTTDGPVGPGAPLAEPAQPSSGDTADGATRSTKAAKKAAVRKTAPAAGTSTSTGNGTATEPAPTATSAKKPTGRTTAAQKTAPTKAAAKKTAVKKTAAPAKKTAPAGPATAPRTDDG
jgi:hypothetical protein